MLSSKKTLRNKLANSLSNLSFNRMSNLELLSNKKKGVLIKLENRPDKRPPALA